MNKPPKDSKIVLEGVVQEGDWILYNTQPHATWGKIEEYAGAIGNFVTSYAAVVRPLGPSHPAFNCPQCGAVIWQRVEEIPNPLPVTNRPPTATEQPITQDNQRLIDLVRYMRYDLHKTGLISNEEYAELVNVGSDAARRLEGYDTLKERERALVEALDAAHELVKHLRAPKMGWYEDIPAFEAALNRYEEARAALAAYGEKP